MNILSLYDECGLFTKTRFPKATAQGHLLKLGHEAAEASESLELEEFADCLICLFAAARTAGHSGIDLFNAADEKLAALWSREWEELPDGTYQHIKQPHGGGE